MPEQGTGIGLTAEVLGQLFRRLEPANSSTAPRFRGTGLGLRVLAEPVEVGAFQQTLRTDARR